KTQMTEFAFSALGLNPHDGEPGNPRDRSRVPGGSSSGAVVSVVDGMAEIAIGSDTGGSLRIPAALSGAVGFKPTSGRVPTAGAFSLSSTLDVVGPIALSVADCALADAGLSGENALSLHPAAPTAFASPGPAAAYLLMSSPRSARPSKGPSRRFAKQGFASRMVRSTPN